MFILSRSMAQFETYAEQAGWLLSPRKASSLLSIQLQNQRLDRASEVIFAFQSDNSAVNQ